MLVPWLVNGSTIRRIPNAELGGHFMVFRIETAKREVIVAEGMPAETFVGASEELPEQRAMCAGQVPLSIRARIARRVKVVAGRATEAA
jgi:hypothetical protein